MSSVYTSIDDKSMFIKKIKLNVIRDLKEYYSNIDFTDLTLGEAIIEINSELIERFIFLIDEWDIIYREQERNTKLCDEYTEFLRNLFKSSNVSACVDLVYMTGILPIRRYSTQSTLNMFKEYNMIKTNGLESYMGFTQSEVLELCKKYNRNFDQIKTWYDGYNLKNIEIYNPKSVVEAVFSGECEDYWVQNSAIEAVTNYMNYDSGVLKDTIAKMLTGEKVALDVTEFGKDLTKVDSRDSALTVLIHLGYLAYDESIKSCYISNYEIRLEFEKAIKQIKAKEYFNSLGNFKGNVLLLGITYNSKTLKHNSKVEIITL